MKRLVLVRANLPGQSFHDYDHVVIVRVGKSPKRDLEHLTQHQLLVAYIILNREVGTVSTAMGLYLEGIKCTIEFVLLLMGEAARPS